MSTIGGRCLGDGSPTYITFEAGPTHDGLITAKKLAKAAKEAGADAIKYQVMDVDRLMADRTVPLRYKILSGEEVTEPLYDCLKRREMVWEDWRILKAYCDEIGIDFFATPLFPDEVGFLVYQLNVPSLKLPSPDINNHELARHMAQTGVNIQVDTGNADLWEIERTIKIIEDEGNTNIIIHLCPTGYPARIESINLNMIKTLKLMFPEYAVAYSDHWPGWEMDIAAVALGANLVEKTLTLDRATRSCEHMFSIEPEEAKLFVQAIRDLEKALGSTRRVISPEQRDAREGARRSPYLVKDIKKGEVITEAHVDFRRPGYGIQAEEWCYVYGRKVFRDMKAGAMLQWNDLE